MKRFRRAWLPMLGWLLLASTVQAVDTNAFLQAWFHAHEQVRTWTAEFTQTRQLKALTQPLTANGKLWFAVPNRFYWEVGHPAQTVAVRQPGRLCIIYPRLKRAELYPLDGTEVGPWRDALALLDAGFPRERADFDRQFRITGLTRTNQAYELSMEPRSPSAKRLLTGIRVRFQTNDFSMLMNEVRFSDGSLLRNDFTNAFLNQPIDEALFTPKLDPDYKISEPFKK